MFPKGPGNKKKRPNPSRPWGGDPFVFVHPFQLTFFCFKGFAAGIIRAANFLTALHIDLDIIRRTFHALPENAVFHTTPDI